MLRSSGSVTRASSSDAGASKPRMNLAAFRILIARRRPILICVGFCGSKAASVPRRDEAAQ